MIRMSGSVDIIGDATMALLSGARRLRRLLRGCNHFLRKQDEVFHDIEGKLGKTGQSRPNRLYRLPCDLGIGQRTLDLKEGSGKSLALAGEQLAEKWDGLQDTFVGAEGCDDHHHIVLVIGNVIG